MHARTSTSTSTGTAQQHERTSTRARTRAHGRYRRVLRTRRRPQGGRRQSPTCPPGSVKKNSDQAQNGARFFAYSVLYWGSRGLPLPAAAFEGGRGWGTRVFRKNKRANRGGNDSIGVVMTLHLKKTVEQAQRPRPTERPRETPRPRATKKKTGRLSIKREISRDLAKPNSACDGLAPSQNRRTSAPFGRAFTERPR